MSSSITIRRLMRGIGVVALVPLILFLKGWRSVPVDMVGLHYSGGPIEGQKFVDVVRPGTSGRFYGVFDHVYLLPATQQSYIMTKTPERGDDKRAEFVGAPALDKVVVQWETATYFKLNADGPKLRQFFEEICVRYRCTDRSQRGGWDRMVADTFRQQIVAAIQEESRRYASEDIYANRQTLLSLEHDIGSSLKKRVNTILGGDFFCGPGSRPAQSPECPEFGFVIKEVTVPPSVQDQYNVNRVAALATENARSEADRKRIEAEAESARQAALAAAPDLTPAQLAYLRVEAELQCARRPGCVLVVGDGVSVEVAQTAPARP